MFFLLLEAWFSLQLHLEDSNLEPVRHTGRREGLNSGIIGPCIHQVGRHPQCQGQCADAHVL